MKIRLLFFLIITLLCVEQGFSYGIDSTKLQKKDTIIAKDKSKVYSPSKAALFSLIPGGGQIYNEQYIKVPIVYAVLGTLGYLVIRYNTEYKDYRQAYRIRSDGDSNTLDKFDPLNPAAIQSDYIASTEILLSNREDARRFRDLNIIIFSAMYVAQMIEAYTSAHLKSFDVSDNLSLQFKGITPNFQNNNLYFTTGLTLKLK